MKIRKLNYWRLIEPIILGSIVNIAVNFFFNPKNPDFILKEFLVAFAFALIITEVSLAIDIYLEKKTSWVINFKKRFFLHLVYLSVSLLAIINVFGNIYIWISGDSFHTLDEIITINSLALLFAFLLTFTKWLIYFYNNWRATSINLNTTTSEFEELKSNIKKTFLTIELQKGNHLFKMNVEEINIIKSEFGIVTIFNKSTDKGIFNGTLNELEKTLPKHLFFRVNRNFILHRNAIISISPSTYGKIQLHISNNFKSNNDLTVSRPKASSFRKWYYSTSG